MDMRYTNVPMNLNECPITLGDKEWGVLSEHVPQMVYTIYKRTIVKLLVNHYNGKLIVSDRKNNQIVKSNVSFVFNQVPISNENVHSYSSPIHKENVVWLVPRAKIIPPMEVIFVTFEKQVWILIVVSFIIVTAAWWFIMSCKQRRWNMGNMAIAMTNLTSLTILGSVAKVPKSAILCCVLITYLVYVIHINCGFTANLINILTQPQYEFQISNLKQLADSNLPIYAPDKFLEFQFHSNVTDCELYTKLKSLTVPIKSSQEYVMVFLKISKHGNSALVTLEEHLFNMQREFSNELKVYKIIDNSITWRINYFRNHYFGVYFENFIAAITESGIGNEIYKNLKEAFLKVPRAEDDEKVVLTLRHLCFAFALLGLGLSLSMVVFFVELAIAKCTYRCK
ncbi:uncharacterized protein LOC116180077 [Photinus pyralis]|uniref:uncharacterized protein LOC116180077 n=1 Tax=Photinus pyralis TaxID=7054 RepID=UPI00126770E6|nr:uncharacterized protein LOC116180077 [Photinus pyralis]